LVLRKTIQNLKSGGLILLLLRLDHKKKHTTHFSR